jgi:hypothetical protein
LRRLPGHLVQHVTARPVDQGVLNRLHDPVKLHIFFPQGQRLHRLLTPVPQRRQPQARGHNSDTTRKRNPERKGEWIRRSSTGPKIDPGCDRHKDCRQQTRAKAAKPRTHYCRGS